jgi:hypothetical protein
VQCCAHCFGDRALERIIADRSEGIGTCCYCGSAGAKLVDPRELEPHFATLISVYEPNPETGQPLIELLMDDWHLFDHPKMDVIRARSLLTDILDNGDIVRARHVFSPRYVEEGQHLRWSELRDELMFKNRYFPKGNIDYDRLEALLGWFESDPASLPQIWYRARIANDDAIFEIADMGAPPATVSSHGRANPAGIPYLYLGSAEQTAAAEIRPHTGDKLCVAEFKVLNPVRLIDLRNPRKLVSPFFFDDEARIAALRNDMPFVERLGLELTRPVMPQRAAIEYVPSQYLCEFIKKVGYDGVIYRSSVSEGMNLALFAPTPKLQ